MRSKNKLRGGSFFRNLFKSKSNPIQPWQLYARNPPIQTWAKKHYKKFYNNLNNRKQRHIAHRNWTKNSGKYTGFTAGNYINKKYLPPNTLVKGIIGMSTPSRLKKKHKGSIGNLRKKK